MTTDRELLELAAKAAAALWTFYFAVSRIGATGSYWDALGTAGAMYMMWWLGRAAASIGQQMEK